MIDQTKENLINSLVCKLSENTDLSMEELRDKICVEMYSWNVSKLDENKVYVKDGSITRILMKYFEIGKMSSNKSRDTINQYIRVVYQLCHMTNKEINMITSDDVKYFLVLYKEIYKVSDATMECKRLYLSSVFSYLYKNNKISDNPMERVDPISYTNKVKKPLTEEEIERIVMACKGDRRSIAMIYFLVSTGVRVSELCSIKIRDIDFDKKRVLVLGKGSKERFVYIDGRTKVRIMDYLKYDRRDIRFENGNMEYELDTPLFASKDIRHHPIHKGCVEKLLHQLGDKSGVDRLHPHLIRATFATRCIQNGVDINIVAKLMGHVKIDTTTRYILLSQDDIEKAIRY